MRGKKFSTSLNFKKADIKLKKVNLFCEKKQEKFLNKDNKNTFKKELIINKCTHPKTKRKTHSSNISKCAFNVQKKKGNQCTKVFGSFMQAEWKTT